MVRRASGDKATPWRQDSANVIAMGSIAKGQGLKGERATTPHVVTGDVKHYPLTRSALVTCWCEHSVVLVPWSLIRVGWTAACPRIECKPPVEAKK